MRTLLNRPHLTVRVTPVDGFVVGFTTTHTPRDSTRFVLSLGFLSLIISLPVRCILW